MRKREIAKDGGKGAMAIAAIMAPFGALLGA